MGFRFRKSVRLLPGVRLNLSKGGVSTSIGGPGATVNIGKRGVRGTVGIPGSGLSYSERLDGGGAPGKSRMPALFVGLGLVGALVFGVATCGRSDAPVVRSAPVATAAPVRAVPAPVAAVSAPESCACGSGSLCTGKRGGRFCLTPAGKKRYAS